MSGELRIGDTEREAAVAALSEHFAAGRLNKEEYDERTAAAFTARTSGALAPLFIDLPAPHASPTATTAALTGPLPTPRSNSGLLPRVPWPVIMLLVALVMAEWIPWPVAAIVTLVWFVRRGHSTRHRSRHHPWHDHRQQPWHQAAQR